MSSWGQEKCSSYYKPNRSRPNGLADKDESTIAQCCQLIDIIIPIVKTKTSQQGKIFQTTMTQKRNKTEKKIRIKIK